ncbi:MAG: recombinase family protein, partial [Elusimicrobia bacterium]|nr:recombinase family protein [Elusimicrobiota bacterium]
PGLSAALDAIRSGKAEALIVKHADRLARDSDLAGHFRVTVKEAGGRLVVIEEAKNDPIRMAVDKMLAELERIRGSQRMKTWNAERKARGLSAGPPPFGMRHDAEGRLEPDPATAGTVSRILRLRGEGASLRAIAEALNADHVPGPTSAPWNPMTVSGVVRRAGQSPA